MKIEAGRTYLNREQEKIGPMIRRRVPFTREFVWRDHRDSDHGYRDDGTFIDNSVRKIISNPRDLVKEA